MQDNHVTTDAPFLERPDEHEPGDELYCWMPGTDHRECNGSCVAFEPASLQDDRKDTCKALNALRSLAMSMGLQAKVAKAMQTQQTVAERKKVSDSLPGPPEVKV